MDNENDNCCAQRVIVNIYEVLKAPVIERSLDQWQPPSASPSTHPCSETSQAEEGLDLVEHNLNQKGCTAVKHRYAKLRQHYRSNSSLPLSPSFPRDWYLRGSQFKRRNERENGKVNKWL